MPKKYSYMRKNAMARTITFEPSKELGEFIESLVETGRYKTTSEVIRDALRLLQERNAASKLEQLKQLIDEAENSPIIDNWNKEDFLKRMRTRINDRK